MLVGSNNNKRTWDHMNIGTCPLFIQKAVHPNKKFKDTAADAADGLGGGGEHGVTKITDDVVSSAIAIGLNCTAGTTTKRRNRMNLASTAFANPEIQQKYQKRRLLQKAAITESSTPLPQRLPLGKAVVVPTSIATTTVAAPLSESEKWKLIRSRIEYDKATYLRKWPHKDHNGKPLFPAPPPLPSSHSEKGALKDNEKRSTSTTGRIEVLILRFLLGKLKAPLSSVRHCEKCHCYTHYAAAVAAHRHGRLWWSQIERSNSYFVNAASQYAQLFHDLISEAPAWIDKMEDLYSSNSNNSNDVRSNVDTTTADALSNRLSFLVSFFFVNPCQLFLESKRGGGTVSAFPHFFSELYRRHVYGSTTAFQCGVDGSIQYGVNPQRVAQVLEDNGSEHFRKGQGGGGDDSLVLQKARKFSYELNFLLKSFSRFSTRQTASATTTTGRDAFTAALLDVESEARVKDSRHTRYSRITNFLHSQSGGSLAELVRWLQITSGFHEYLVFPLTYPVQRQRQHCHSTANLQCHRCKEMDQSMSNPPVIPLSQDLYLLKTLTKFSTLLNSKSNSSSLGIQYLSAAGAGKAKSDDSTSDFKTAEQFYDYLTTPGRVEEESALVLQTSYSDRLYLLLEVIQSLLEFYTKQWCENEHGDEPEGTTSFQAQIKLSQRLKQLGEIISLTFLRVAIMLSNILTETEFEILIRLASVGGYDNSLNEYWGNLRSEFSNLCFQYKGENNWKNYDKKDVHLSQQQLRGGEEGGYPQPVYHLSVYDDCSELSTIFIV